MNIKTLKDKVYKILEQYPNTRNSDITLTTRVWTTYYSHIVKKDENGDLIARLVDLHELPREDHIKRVRADIQNVEKKFLPTEFSIFLKRLKNSKVWRDELGYSNWWSDEVLENKAKEIYNDYKRKEQSLFPDFK